MVGVTPSGTVSVQSTVGPGVQWRGATEVDGAVGEFGVAEVDVAANVPRVVVSKRFGHSSVALTADTCSYVLKGVDRRAAEAAAALVP
ncbi:MAG: hypothetical protein ACXVXQ_03460 [Mycobacteriaceae bacterium]